MSKFRVLSIFAAFTYAVFSLLASQAPVSARHARPNRLPSDGKTAPEQRNTEGVLSKYGHLRPEQLFDTARYYDLKREYDTAIICYNLIINDPETDTGQTRHQRLKIDALTYSAVVYYYWLSDYVKAYRLLIDALDLCETSPYEEAEFLIHANIGNIYYHLDEYEMAGQYYSRALELCSDSAMIMLLHNNIAAVKMETGELDSALFHIERSMRISDALDGANLYGILHTAASIDHKRGLFDSALRYFELALDDARKNGKIEYEAENLSGIGKLLARMGRPEEAGSYIASSSVIAQKNNLNNILLGNYLILSQIERSGGRYLQAMEYMDRYNGLKDSLFSADKLANINQLQRIGEVSKANRQIEKLAVEQQIKERTIGYQQVIMLISFAVLSLVVAVLLLVWRQKRRLNKAYRTLFEKNIEIMELQGDPSRKHLKNAPYYDNDKELLGRILAVMEDTEAICNPKFSINMLSILAGSNHTYVSQVINTAMHKNFRSFLNGYRIREAQRLFSEPGASKYTLESVSLQLGYRSQNTFRAAFQEITGVSPSFYLRSLRETP